MGGWLSKLHELSPQEDQELHHARRQPETWLGRSKAEKGQKEGFYPSLQVGEPR